jgi:hypothetical protein
MNWPDCLAPQKKKTTPSVSRLFGQLLNLWLWVGEQAGQGPDEMSDVLVGVDAVLREKLVNFTGVGAQSLARVSKQVTGSLALLCERLTGAQLTSPRPLVSMALASARGSSGSSSSSSGGAITPPPASWTRPDVTELLALSTAVRKFRLLFVRLENIHGNDDLTCRVSPTSENLTISEQYAHRAGVDEHGGSLDPFARTPPSKDVGVSENERVASAQMVWPRSGGKDEELYCMWQRHGGATAPAAQAAAAAAPAPAPAPAAPAPATADGVVSGVDLVRAMHRCGGVSSVLGQNRWARVVTELGRVKSPKLLRQLRKTLEKFIQKNMSS